MKGLRVTKDVNETKFEEASGDLELKTKFSETINYKIFETNSSFLVK